MSQRDIIVLAGYLVRCPLGGYAWQALHFLAGLRALGFEPYFYEDTAYYSDCFDPLTGNMHVAPDAGIAFAGAFFERFGFGDRWIFWNAESDRHHGLARTQAEDVLNQARAVITLAPVNRVARRQARQTKIFIDIDPAFTQIQAANGDRALIEVLSEHDLHFTIGENIGTPGCAIPTGPFHWRPTRQPIALDFWNPVPADPQAAFTTIGRWNERRRDLSFRGELYAWNKRAEWLKFVELPCRSGARFLIAMDVDATPGDRQLLSAEGWEIADPLAVSRNPGVYRDFIRTSRGEFTVAKDLNVRLGSGWFSDRAACYLAAGRPVVTQTTGFDRILPTGKGLFAVHALGDTVEAILAINADYDAHAQAARAIAQQYFDAAKVMGNLLGAL